MNSDEEKQCICNIIRSLLEQNKNPLAKIIVVIFVKMMKLS